MCLTARSSRSQSSSLEAPYSLDVLPPELLAYTFTFAWPKRRFAQQVPFEVQLSHVCRKWRDIALSTPVLWTKISIYSPDSLKWVPIYLQRSGTRLPLSLLVDVYRWDKSRRYSDGMIRTKFASCFFAQIRPHLDRIYHLSLVCYCEFTATSFQNPFAATSAPNLEAINVQFERCYITEFSPPPQAHKILAGGTPKLTFIDTPFITYLYKANLLHLTTLFLRLTESAPLMYFELVEFLTAPSALLHLSLTGSSNLLLTSWPFHLLQPDPTLQLNTLKSLRIVDGNQIAVKFLLSVSVPQLESLWLDCSFDSFHNFFDAQQIHAPISSGGLSKFRSVKYLTIPEYNLTWVVKFSEAFPNVTHLHFPHVNFFHIDLLITALANWQDLQSLVFTQARQSRWEKFTIALAGMLEERGLTSHPIKSLIMDRDFGNMLKERIPHISELVEVLDLSRETYKEPWWSKMIGNPYEDEL